MTPERWRQVTRVYGAVMTKPPAARAAALAELCPDDEALRKEVESLLADDSGGALLDRPLADVAASVVQHDLTGRTLGPYRLESAIGAGGMGQVYRANDTRLHRTVAVKVLAASLADDPQFRARFDREAKAIAALNHPNICTLHDVGSADGVGSARARRPAVRSGTDHIDSDCGSAGSGTPTGDRASRSQARERDADQ